MIKDRLKVLARTAAYAVGVACAARGAEPLCWERVPNRPAPAQFDTFHGETLDFRCTFAGFGALPFSEGGDVRLWYQTNGMGSAWWSIPATVSSNTVTATFPPSADPGAERLAVFFGAPSNAYAAAQVRFRNSPGPHPNDLEPPSVLDWQAELSAAIDALWASSAAAFMPKTNAYTKAETDARIEQLAPRTSLAPATNYTDQAIGAFAATGTVNQATTASYATDAGSASVAITAQVAERLGDPDTSEIRTSAQIFAALDSKVTTNDVCNIVTNTVTDVKYVGSTRVDGTNYVFTLTNFEWYVSYGASRVRGVVNDVTFDGFPDDIGSGYTPTVSAYGGDVYMSIPYGGNTTPDMWECRFEPFPGPGASSGSFRFSAAISTRNALGLARLTDIPSTNGLATKVYVDEAIAAAGGGGEWVETNVTATLRFVTGYEHVTVPSGGTLTADTNDWPNGAALMVHLVPGGTYTVSGITLLGYQTWPTNRAEMVVFRSGTNMFANVILTY